MTKSNQGGLRLDSGQEHFCRIIGILEVLVTHGKARLSSLESPGNNITDGLCDWLSREVEKSSGKMFSAVKEVGGEVRSGDLRLAFQIDLSYNYLTAVGVGKLVKACPGLGHLDVGGILRSSRKDTE